VIKVVNPLQGQASTANRYKPVAAELFLFNVTSTHASADLGDRAAQNTTQYAYDTENNLTSITDAKGRVTSFHYDAYRRVTETDFPSSYNETYGYDAIGNLTSKTDSNGQTIRRPKPLVLRFLPASIERPMGSFSDGFHRSVSVIEISSSTVARSQHTSLLCRVWMFQFAVITRNNGLQ
jgi:YD repeat-containing protein